MNVHCYPFRKAARETKLVSKPISAFLTIKEFQIATVLQNRPNESSTCVHSKRAVNHS